MVIKDTTKLFMYWHRVVRLYVQITIGVKLGEIVRLDEHMHYILDLIFHFGGRKIGCLYRDDD
jgi:hypothetical protein